MVFGELVILCLERRLMDCTSRNVLVKEVDGFFFVLKCCYQCGSVIVVSAGASHV